MKESAKNAFEYFEEYIGDKKHVSVIKGNERLEEIKIYPSIFENDVIECYIIPIIESWYGQDI